MMPGPDKHKSLQLVRKLGFVTILMFGFGYAMVPLYNVMCNAFGINGRFTAIADGTYKAPTSTAGNVVDANRTVTVEFMTTLNNNLDWDFYPETHVMQVHPGQTMSAKFYAKNKTGRAIVAQAIPSIVPSQAVKYFSKIECFCFSQQVFAAGEAKDMPLVFFVDSALPKDVKTISLSYTFFVAPDQKKAQAANSVQHVALTK